ncbi:DUF456 domain-containing protein [Halegenticoccus tardaugens]|uniref:DUF456 domain-containing protein n=1 Tax=Halegenticoccus tardaugens TaxID=2071624 RepID=UPI00100C330E|nr:DUF456 domain-containing protein [Halegenticoccus tardaugens]
MNEALALLAFVLLFVGVIGSVVPLVPGALSSLAGVYLYWHATSYAEPGPVVLAALTLVGLVGFVVDYFSGPIAARAGGASTLTTAVAAAVGVLLVFVVGPVGLVLGVAGTVFALEFSRNRDANASLRAALFASVGVLASTVVQVLLTASMLLAMVLVVAL